MTEPNTAPEEDPRLKELEVLRRAFASFNEVTGQLQKSYDTLQMRIQELDLELSRKNDELERNLAEKEEVKNYLDFILQSLTNGVIVLDGEGVITTFNQTAATITGLAPETCLGKKMSAVFDHDVFQKLVDRSYATGAESMSLEETLNSDPGASRTLRLWASPARDNHHRRIGTVLVLQDITREKRLEEEAHRNDRLRAMGEMAAGIAHEIRNPMGGIELFASLLKRDLETKPDQLKLADHIISGIRNIDRIISSLLLFAKSPEPSKQKCDLNSLLKELVNNPEHLEVPENISVEWDLGQPEILGAGDTSLLTQVILNCIRNGLQAMPEGGQLSLTTRESDPPGDAAYHRRYVTIGIGDTGPGISPEDRARIFNPFFTTKDKGTGLGLAIAHNIIKAHQGAIDCESEPGGGTRFMIHIPKWEAA